MFSICSAIAFASKIPTQIGNTRSPTRSLRITMGMFVTGSTMSPLIVISISMWLRSLSTIGTDRLAPQAVGARATNGHGDGLPDPVVHVSGTRRDREIHYG